MPKRVDKNDSTMDISASQLVPSGKRPPVPHQPGVDKNDVSMWIGGVVGADDFAGAKKGAAKRGRGLPIVLGLVLLAAAGAGAYYFLFARSTESPSQTAAALPAGSAAMGSPEGSGSATGSAAPPSEVPAAVATAPADAGVETPAVGDGGVAGAMALNADAVSAADPKVKPATKKKVTKKKKPVVKKKPATRRK